MPVACFLPVILAVPARVLHAVVPVPMLLSARPMCMPMSASVVAIVVRTVVPVTLLTICPLCRRPCKSGKCDAVLVVTAVCVTTATVMTVAVFVHLFVFSFR